MMRLLFVDDEPRVLQGLRQSLRSQRKVWELEFVESGAAALERLSAARFDAVISDIRMPCMDGAELLSRVRALQPHSLRVVLSGQMDHTTAARAAASAHRFLSKPCETSVLITTLTRALEVREQLSSEELRSCIGGMGGLPSLPSHCAELRRVIQDEAVTLKDVAQIVERDVGMTVKVLQLVNSAFFGLPRQLANIEQAIMHLGLNAMNSLVIAHALFEELTGTDVELLRQEEERSLLAASYARRFVLDGHQADLAVAGAMLHNVGRLALMSRLPAEYHATRSYAVQHGLTIHEAEKLRLGVQDAAIGAYLLGLWGLPFEVIQAVGSQHASPETLTVLDTSAVVYLAKSLAAEAAPPDSADLVPLPDDLLSRLGVAHVVRAIREERASKQPAQGRSGS